MKWTRASEDNLPRPEDMPKCGRLLGPNGIWYYGTIQMVAEIISAARNKPLHKNKAMYTEWLDESPESSVWPGESDWKVLEEIIADKLMAVNGHKNGTSILMIEIMAWLQSRTAGSKK